MMKNAPGIDEVERPELFQVVAIEHRSSLDDPVRVPRKIASLELDRTGDRLRIIVKRMNLGANAPCDKTKEPAARPHVQEGLPVQAFRLQHRFKGTFSDRNALVIENAEKPRP